MSTARCLLVGSGVVVEAGGDGQPLALRGMPLALSFAVLAQGDETPLLLMDPTADEEAACRASLTLVLDVDAGDGADAERCAAAQLLVHKPGGKPLPQELLIEAIAAARKRATRLLPLLEGR
jgi:exosome complex RNA-binding protein Rrp42 (RNase PH superfamily)